MITLDDRRVSRILSPQSRRFRLHTEHPTPRAARPIPIAAGFPFPPARRSKAPMVQRGTERLMLMRVILPRDRLGAARDGKGRASRGWRGVGVRS